MCKSARWILVIGISLEAIVQLVSAAHAQFFRAWTSASGGSYSNPFNWNPLGVPNANDGAGFALDATYTVAFPSNETTGVVTVSDGSVTFDMNTSGTARTLNIPGTLTVRNDTGTLLVRDGAAVAGNILVESGGLLSGSTTASISAGDGSIIVRNPGSVWTTQNGFLRVGENGTGTLRVENGGRVFNNDGTAIGRFVSSNGTATITGSNSTFDVAANLTIAQEGMGTINVEDGGSIESGGVTYLGFEMGASGTATVTGPGSNWVHDDDFIVGNRGSGNLTIADGGSISTPDLNDSFKQFIVANEMDSSGTVTVTGAGSNLTTARNAQIGRRGTGTLNISDGGTVSLGISGSVGTFEGGDGTIVVTGTDSLLETRSFFLVGGVGKGKLRVLDGAMMTHRRVTIGDARFGDGEVEVSGPGSTLVSSNETINVGRRGEGHMRIASFGSVISSFGSIGQEDDGQGTGDGHVDIVGGGSWTINNRLAIGGAAAFPANGGSGRVFLNGGVLDVGDEIILYPDGVLDLFSGDVFANAIQFDGGGVFDWNRGALHVGQYHGDLVNTRGALAPGNPVGDTVVFGDYTQGQDATLQIDVGGLAMGTKYDFVNVVDDAVLDGELELSLVDGFIPNATDTFTVFNAASLLGFFDNAGNGGRLETSDGSGSFKVNYGVASTFNPNQIVLSDFEAASADFDNDGDVDGADFLAIQRTNPALISLWQTQYGSGAGLRAPTRSVGRAPVGAVPEPSAGVCFCITTMLLVFFARSERR